MLIFVLMFSIVGCGGSSDRRTVNYRTGSQALEMLFINPGTEDFYEGDRMTVLVEYFNRGTANIVSGEFFVSGYDMSIIGALSLDPKFISIEGKDEYDPTGSLSKIMTIRSSPLRLPANTEDFRQTIKLTSCYTYQTLVSADICIDPDPTSRRIQDKICQMRPVSPGAQGAPLVVTNVEPIVSRNDIRLNIEFANQGGGIPFDRSISNLECFAALDRYESANIIHLVKVELSGKRFDCQPRGPIRLIGDRGKISCECKGCINEYMDAYQTRATIELEYGYRNEVLKNIRILK